MNPNLLDPKVQEFIDLNFRKDLVKLLLRKQLFPQIDQKALVTQLECKKKSELKLPTWFAAKGIYYPRKINMEQTSSEVTAAYKAALVSGHCLVDLTGGFGVDAFHFSKTVENVIHCEIDTVLSTIAQHNFKQLGVKNMTCHKVDGLHFLQESPLNFDWIYLDPSRRNATKGKVFRLEEYTPTILEHLEVLLSKSANILLKTSPLLDLSLGIKKLKAVKEIHVVAVKNEVKELLWVLEKEFLGEPKIIAIDLGHQPHESFSFHQSEELTANATFSYPQQFLYEPNASILKSGAFKSVAAQCKLNKLAEHSHLYTSRELKEFMGKKFEIQETLVFNKKNLKKFKGTRADLSVRNFHKSVEALRQEGHIKPGGNTHVFFTTSHDSKRLMIVCKRVL